MHEIIINWRDACVGRGIFWFFSAYRHIQIHRVSLSIHRKIIYIWTIQFFLYIRIHKKKGTLLMKTKLYVISFYAIYKLIILKIVYFLTGYFFSIRQTRRLGNHHNLKPTANPLRCSNIARLLRFPVPTESIVNSFFFFFIRLRRKN